jgi:hypothetical protein
MGLLHSTDLTPSRIQVIRGRGDFTTRYEEKISVNRQEFSFVKQRVFGLLHLMVPTVILGLASMGQSLLYRNNLIFGTGLLILGLRWRRMHRDRLQSILLIHHASKK